MYKTINVKDIQKRLGNFAFNHLMRLMKSKRNSAGFAWDVENNKCVIVGPRADATQCTLTLWQIRNKCNKSPPDQFTFFFI